MVSEIVKQKGQAVQRLNIETLRSNARDNSAVIAGELDAFTRFLADLGFHHDRGIDTKRLREGDLALPLPELMEDGHSYSRFVRQQGLSPLQRSILILVLLPELRPGILDQLFVYDKRIEKCMADFGGVRGKSFSGFLPTVETALFLFAGYHLQKRFAVLKEFHDGALLIQCGILILEPDHGEPFASRKIEISKEVLADITEMELSSPHCGSDFPAKRLESPLVWSADPEENDLVLNTFTRDHLNEMINWIEHHERLDAMKLMRGYRCLFHGPPGTGKTLTATLVGQRFAMQVYRIDLSLMVSKYIGETEKNLEKVFSIAEHRKDWILFFDEADALFGKRTDLNSANDKFANQETSFLLQRVEAFPGLAILATNFKENIDQAFLRRFQSIINFPMPNRAERALLWRKALKKVSNPGGSENEESYVFSYADDVDIQAIAEKVELSGAAIDNVMRYCVLCTFKRRFKNRPSTKGQTHACLIERSDLLKAIKREMNKEGNLH